MERGRGQGANPTARGAKKAPVWPLAVAASFGVVIAASGLSGEMQPEKLAPSEVARVNGVAIPRADYERMLSSLAADRKTGRPSEEDRRRVIRRLIEEELLLQRAVELGLVRLDPRARKALTHAMIDAIVQNTGEEAPPSDEALLAFYEENRALFVEPALAEIEQIFFRADGDPARARRRAEQARERLSAGESFADLKRDADAEVVPLPGGALPASKLVDYLGPTVARAALTLPIGEISEPLVSALGAHLVRVKARREAAAPRFEEVRDRVAFEYRKNQGEERLRNALAEMREEADIVVDEELE